MIRKKLLFIGFGKLAQHAAKLLAKRAFDITGIARREDPKVDGVTYWQGDFCDTSVQRKFAQSHFDMIVVTLTPGGRTIEDYRNGYFNIVKQLTDSVDKLTHNLPHIVYISSTRVFGQNKGEWISEQSVTCPCSEQGRLLLATENLLLQHPADTTIIRFSGIYGNSRDYLIRQVKQGEQGNHHFTNRIHEDDAVAVMCFIVNNLAQGEKVSELYLASDCFPAKSVEVYDHIRDRFFPELTRTDKSIDGSENTVKGKRVSNERLLQEGFTFKYPSYKEGYHSMLINPADTP